MRSAECAERWQLHGRGAVLLGGLDTRSGTWSGSQPAVSDFTTTRRTVETTIGKLRQRSAEMLEVAGGCCCSPSLALCC